jgi:competence protein ComEA
MPARPEAAADDSRRDLGARQLLFAAGLVVLAAVLATWHTRSIAKRYSPAFASTRVDVNQASADELAGLPGVGETLARRIVAARTSGGRFRDVGDLVARVDGLGELAAGALASRVAFGE